MRISVALCTYNGERFIRSQLDSLLTQTFLPSQIVICDDRSTDATVAVCRDFAERARAIGVDVVLQSNPINLGYVRNFERTLSLCDGELVFLCDQDDIWHPEKLELYHARFESEPDLLLLHSDARLVDALGRPLGNTLFQTIEVSKAELSQIHVGKALDVLLLRNLVTGATAAFRRSLVATALPVADGWIHDEWLAIVAAASGGRVDCLEWPSTDYRQHGGNQLGAVHRGVMQKAQGGQARRDFLLQVAIRLDSLRERSLRAGWLGVDSLQDIARRAAHVRCRAGLPANPFARMMAVMPEILRGNYWRYANGWRSLMVDLARLS